MGSTHISNLFCAGVKMIQLTQGQKALVDDGDYEWLNQFKWFAQKCVRKCRTVWYAGRLVKTNGGCRQLRLMHREILGVADPKIEVDHKDGNTLDNRKSNLRAATRRQNGQNRHKEPGCSSRFKGVHWNKKLSKWQASIQNRARRTHLGLFDSEEAAAAAYDLAAEEAFGEFSLLNL